MFTLNFMQNITIFQLIHFENVACGPANSSTKGNDVSHISEFLSTGQTGFYRVGAARFCAQNKPQIHYRR